MHKRLVYLFIKNKRSFIQHKIKELDHRSKPRIVLAENLSSLNLTVDTKHQISLACTNDSFCQKKRKEFLISRWINHVCPRKGETRLNPFGLKHHATIIQGGGS
uniref:Uncharacterized protein n=1 Tax=Zea mays TaxID=4577 RepID=A0A804LJ41_MAIZE